MKKILAFTGSNHSQSIHQNLIDIAVEKFTKHDVKVINLIDFPLPIYSLDIEADGIPEQVNKLRQVMNDHDALLIASPEHNGSMPAFLKNVIDWLSRVAEPGQPFFGETKKPVLLLSTSPGATGGANNINNMAALMPWWGGDVRGTYSLGSYYENVVDDRLAPDADFELSQLINSFEAAL